VIFLIFGIFFNVFNIINAHFLKPGGDWFLIKPGSDRENPEGFI
jgi:hypothetical protein